ncbi:MAG: STAS domain-containing protein [Magnetospirillum sp. WYHS-4]
MKHDVRDEGKAVVVAFQGDVDLESSREARKVLLEAAGRKKALLVDLSGVSYIDSSGVASLVEALQTAKKNGQALALVAVSEAALRVLRLARLDKIFVIHPTVAEGLNLVP